MTKNLLRLLFCVLLLVGGCYLNKNAARLHRKTWLMTDLNFQFAFRGIDKVVCWKKFRL